MPELVQEGKPAKKRMRISWIVFWIFSLFSLFSMISIAILPLVPLPASEHQLINHAEGALVGEWGEHCCRTYALFSDGREMVRMRNFGIIWTFGSIIRLHVPSPHYIKNPEGNICRVAYTRPGLFDPFNKSCVQIQMTDQLHFAFFEGHRKFVEAAQYTKALYENYRTFGLVE